VAHWTRGSHSWLSTRVWRTKSVYGNFAQLKGSARDKFQRTLLHRLKTENTTSPSQQKMTPDELFQMTMEEVGKSYFPFCMRPSNRWRTCSITYA
jgi:hypothetical protein